MTDERRYNVTPALAAAAIVSTLLVGAGGTYLLMRDGRIPKGARPAASTAERTAEPTAAPRPDVVVTLSKEAADRAGITVTPVSVGHASDSLRVPGVVEPNAYRQVTVTPLVAGRVVQVPVQLGEHVRKGQLIAQVYSPELADARTKYVAAKSMLDAHDRELQRTTKLVEIGGASRQELERVHAEHAAQTAEVESTRARLRLLGADPEDPPGSNARESATTNVPAPIDGVITERAANAGLNVDSTTKLFTIVDLSSVWIVADVYERDLHLVRQGARATVTTAAYPERALEGRVGFIDPQLTVATRTAKVRVEVANPRSDLRLGMYTDVAIESADVISVPVVPKDSVQSVGGRQVVYVSFAGDPMRFVEREVRLGRVMSNDVEILTGVAAGDSVVSKGSFFIRAEAERLGLRGSERSESSLPAVQEARIAVGETSFQPDKVTLRASLPARLTFVRTTDKTCATEVVMPSLNIKRALPLNEPVAIEFTPAKTGDVAFACGMGMLRGVLVVQ